MSNLENKVELLEERSVDALVDYLEARKPEKSLIDKARIAQGAFASVQRRKSAENQRDALSYMMQRDGLGLRHRPALTGSGSGAGETSS